jgi:type II secretory pathway pseudopilin PulG
MMILRPIQGERGTSLVELMVSSLIFLLVAAGGMRFLILQHQWAVRQEDTAEAQQQVRAAVDFMGREIGLLGFGLPEGAAKILKASGQEVEFLANLHAAAARLTETAQDGLSRLSIQYENGSDQFKQGKTVSICSLDYCERHVLAKDGGIDNLQLTEGITNNFPPNSTVQIINRVRYALKPEDASHFKLIRTVDGGANPVAEGLAALELVYLDRAGQTTTVLVDIRRIQIHLTARMARTPDQIRLLEAEVYLRNG